MYIYSLDLRLGFTGVTFRFKIEGVKWREAERGCSRRAILHVSTAARREDSGPTPRSEGRVGQVRVGWDTPRNRSANWGESRDGGREACESRGWGFHDSHLCREGCGVGPGPCADGRGGSEPGRAGRPGLQRRSVSKEARPLRFATVRLWRRVKILSCRWGRT